jgi:hypothetical protein
VRDWVTWHEQYDDPASRLSARLTLVKQQLARALDRAPAGPVRLAHMITGLAATTRVSGRGGGSSWCGRPSGWPVRAVDQSRYHTASENLRPASGIARFPFWCGLSGLSSMIA